MPSWDVYDDGIAITVDLQRPASPSDIEALRRLLDAWLAPYESESGQSYRNCGHQGDVGSRRLAVWADRVADPAGPEAAVDRARAIGEQAATVLPVASWRVGPATEASDADLEVRLGAPLTVVRPRSRRWPFAAGAALVIVLAAGCLWGRWWLFTPPGVRHLPWEARNIEYAEWESFPDFSVWIQAELSDDACRRHVREQYPELTPLHLDRLEPDERHWASWAHPWDDRGEPAAWWSPTELDPSNTWSHHVGGSWSIVQCAEGRIHMRFFTH